MNSYLKEYGMFIISSLAITILIFILTFARNEMKDMSQAFIANLTGVENTSYNATPD